MLAQCSHGDTNCTGTWASIHCQIAHWLQHIAAGFAWFAWRWLLRRCPFAAIIFRQRFCQRRYNFRLWTYRRGFRRFRAFHSIVRFGCFLRGCIRFRSVSIRLSFTSCFVANRSTLSFGQWAARCFWIIKFPATFCIFVIVIMSRSRWSDQCHRAYIRRWRRSTQCIQSDCFATQCVHTARCCNDCRWWKTWMGWRCCRCLLMNRYFNGGFNL